MKAKLLSCKVIEVEGKKHVVWVYSNPTKPCLGQSWRSHSKYIRSPKHTQWNKTGRK